MRRFRLSSKSSSDIRRENNIETAKNRTTVLAMRHNRKHRPTSDAKASQLKYKKEKSFYFKMFTPNLHILSYFNARVS
jgi:hypothetical protein